MTLFKRLQFQLQLPELQLQLPGIATLTGFQPQCRYCQDAVSDPRQDLCPGCHKELRDRQVRCFCCALPLLSRAEPDQRLICGECLAAPPPYHRSVCADNYAPPISGWLKSFKDRRDLRDGQLLSRRLAEQIVLAYRDDGLPQWLIPVPLHWQRCLWRSFNQSAWVAGQLQRSIHVPVLNALRRGHRGGDQRQLGRHQRQRNLRHAFTLPKRHWATLKGSHVALVDDVVTTTATARTLGQLLRKHGAARVDIWCLARTDKT